MKSGLYEHIVNEFLSKNLFDIDDKHKHLSRLNDADSNDYLAQYLYRILSHGLSEIKGDKNGKTKIDKQIEICNAIVDILKSYGIETHGLDISETAEKLMAVLDQNLGLDFSRPDTPLSLGALLTGTRQDPSLISQLKKEILSSDRVNILCSFIKWSGIRILQEELKEFTSRKGSELRVITTSYMGATDSKAIEFLENLPNTSLKVSYDTRRTRLHAKAYLFERQTGFSSAYIGSSNISNAALTDGLEWNIKISQYEQLFQWVKIKATFDTYWNDREFETYSKDDKSRLIKALQAEKYDNTTEFVMPNFDLTPYPFQREILESIWAERQLHRNKHLIVAATGTGKTMIAAFDFKKFRHEFFEAHKREPYLLFVAHREEILKQSLYTFRMVLRNHNFGDMMIDGNVPTNTEQIFASIQTYNSKEIHDLLDSEYYDYIVVDEFHHAAAPSYKLLLDHVRPSCLLGLTATPERADNLDIKMFFDNHITAEIRLPDAIDRKLLCPFQYFGIADSVDYSKLKWQRGGYVQSELSDLYLADNHRAEMICEKTVQTVLDIRYVKGLGFCVSKVHAEYMSGIFNKYGIPSEYLTSDSSKDVRSSVQKRLLNKEINFIFVVDLYNEGVDIPEIDTVLFLRPTESLTIFLQQLGRGLRLSDDKDCLTVLDFVGQANKNYRFDLKFKALIENIGQDIDLEIEQGFPHLPAGCSIELERKSKEYILDNISQALNLRRQTIVNRISSFVADTGMELSFENFISYYNLDLDDIYKKMCWSRALAEAEIIGGFNEPHEEQLTSGLRRIQHIDDSNYIDCVLRSLTGKSINEEALSGKERYYLTMFVLTIWNKDKFASLKDAFSKLLDNPVLYDEIIMLLKYKKSIIKTISSDIALPYVSSLSLHSRYTQAEALAGVGYFDLQNNHTIQTGVLYIKDKKTDVFFITLNKNEKDYSPTTMYNDYAINENLFHWQSQASTRIDSETGQRYINHIDKNQTIILFVRVNKSINSLSQPYYFLGPVDYVSHEGEKPINFVWQLKYPMPAHLLRETARLVVG
ncbi:DEAD/DEAH box helicase [Methanolobus sp.]|uniref:DEAD/DEAH box helicase n=1 Tax=Methanolobus sp. TaxID=1874737 RepID=UPI0025D9FFC5|nr:DEAD/DEAH box helicase [Methanolobus sp.]